MSALRTQMSASNEEKQKGGQKIQAPALILRVTGRDQAEAEGHRREVRSRECHGTVEIMMKRRLGWSIAHP